MSDQKTLIKEEFRRAYVLFRMQYNGAWDIKEERSERIRFWIQELEAAQVNPEVIYQVADSIRKLSRFEEFPPNTQQFIHHAQVWEVENSRAEISEPSRLSAWIVRKVYGDKCRDEQDKVEYAEKVIGSCRLSREDLDSSRKYLEFNGWPTRTNRVRAVLGVAAVNKLQEVSCNLDTLYQQASRAPRQGDYQHPVVIRAREVVGLARMGDDSYVSRRSFEEALYGAAQDFIVDPYGEPPLLPDADEKKEIGSHEITSSVVAELLKGL